jgi:hypothetical protein
MEWVALLFFLALAKARAQCRYPCDHDRASNVGQRQKGTPTPVGREAEGGLAASLARCSPLQGCASLVPCHPSLLPPRAIRSNFSRVSQAAHFGL